MTDKPDFNQEEQVDDHVASLEPNYIGVFWWLVGLTIAEILVAAASNGPMFPKMAQAGLLVLMALAKAGFVALYFMHLKFEKPVLGVIALTPLFLCALLIFALLPDLTSERKKVDVKPDQTTEQVANMQQLEPVDGN